MVRERNEQLRAARESSPSRDVPGLPMSRQELAELVNAYLYESTGKVHELDANYIGKLERGVIRWPQESYRQALRHILGASSDTDLGFVNIRRIAATGAAEVKRQEFLRAAFVGVGALTTPSSLLGLLEPASADEVSRTVSHSDIEQVRGAADLLVSWGNSHGGAGVRQAADAQLRWFAQLLEAHSSGSVRVELHEALGLLGHATAHMAFDACAYDEARRLYGFSLACAEEVQSWHVRAKILSSMARLEIWRGEADEGLTFAELALVRADRLTATEQAMLHTARARALAKLGRRQDTLRAVGAADDAFSATAPADDPPWMAYYDAAQHSGDTGHALFDLSVLGHSTDAAARLRAAIDGHTSDYARSRAMSQTKLASLTMAVGDPQEAVDLGHAAVAAAGRLHSRRAVLDLGELSDYAAAHAATPGVGELRHRLATVGTA